MSLSGLRAPNFMRSLLENAKISSEGTCLRIDLDKGIERLLDERGLLHGAALAALSIITAELAVANLPESSNYIATNSFISFIRQASDVATLSLEACIENTTSISATIATTILADGIEVAKSTTFFIKFEGET